MISELVYPELKTTQRLNFDGTNFTIWKMKLQFVLVDNAVNYVLTDPKPPEPTDDTLTEDANGHKKWLADDFTCRHLILGTMDDLLYLTFYHHTTAKSLMDALAVHFRPTLSRRIALFCRYVNHRMPEDAQISQHIVEMGVMARELEIAGVNVPDEMQVAVLTESLPASWKDVVSGLLVRMNTEDMTLDAVREKLKVVGELRALRAKNQRDQGTSNARNYKKSSKGFKGNCYSCGKPGHYQSDCPESDVF